MSAAVASVPTVTRELKRIKTPGRDVVVSADDFGAVILAVELIGGPAVVALLEQEDVDQLAGALSSWLGISPFSPGEQSQSPMCGSGYVLPSGTVYCELPEGHPGKHHWEQAERGELRR
jgi:hypothetical protein